MPSVEPRGRQMRRQKLGGRAKKTSRPPNTPKIARRRSSVITLDETSAERLSREHTEALEQQAATDEVLRIIRRSPANAQPVFDAIVESASRLCGAVFSAVYLYDDDHFRIVATNNFSREATRQILELRQQRKPDRSHIAGRAILERAITHVPDVPADPEYSREWALAGGWRSVLAVPLLRDNNPLGVLSVSKAEPIPFSDRQIQLLKTFADQALIAIENVRLFEAERQRTNDLSEALEQQTATSEVLKVISSSPGELEPVFGAMLANATRICEAKFGTLFRFDGKAFHRAAGIGVPSALAEFQKKRGPYLPESGTLLDRVLQTRKVAHSPDYAAEPIPGNAAKLGGARSTVAVPMLKDSELVGAIIIYRQEVKPFTDKQIELVKNFAAQAVIAIENTRLLNELRQRTDDLTESLEQQTATSEVLRVISSSPTNVQPVFDAIAESAVRLCDGQFSFVMRFDGKLVDFASYCGLTAEGLKAFRSILPMPASEDTAAGRAIVRRAVVEISDVGADPSYGARGRGLAKAVAYRSIAAVPLLHEGNPIGAIAVARANAGPFPNRQIVLLQAFADQAVIAIENVRLFDEVQARTLELAKSLEDLRTTQDRLVQTQKLALLGQLTAGIAHEIKNPLNFVNNFSGISAELVDELQDTLNGMPLDDKARTQINELTNMLKANFDKVVHHGKRADAIVKNMLQHSREGSGEHRVIDINALVEESLNLAWHGARAETQGFEIKLRQSFDPSAGEADIFPQDIRRALLNLIANGFYAATRRRAETNGGDYEPTLTASTRSLGDRVEIRIRDNGTGMPPDVKEKMFNPFFTTKPTGEGTGLGLSISHDIIVKQHGGSIEVETQPGEYTEFRIVLPRTAGSLAGSAGQK